VVRPFSRRVASVSTPRQGGPSRGLQALLQLHPPGPTARRTRTAQSGRVPNAAAATSPGPSALSAPGSRAAGPGPGVATRPRRSAYRGDGRDRCGTRGCRLPASPGCGGRRPGWPAAEAGHRTAAEQVDAGAVQAVDQTHRLMDGLGHRTLGASAGPRLAGERAGRGDLVAAGQEHDARTAEAAPRLTQQATRQQAGEAPRAVASSRTTSRSRPDGGVGSRRPGRGSRSPVPRRPCGPGPAVRAAGAARREVLLEKERLVIVSPLGAVLPG